MLRDGNNKKVNAKRVFGIVILICFLLGLFLAYCSIYGARKAALIFVLACAMTAIISFAYWLIYSNPVERSAILNTKVIVRGDRSGVFFGTLASKEGQEVKLENCRRLWYWDGAASLSQLAMEGVTEPENCKFTVTVNEIIITDVIEIIPCTDKAIGIIEGVREWKR